MRATARRNLLLALCGILLLIRISGVHEHLCFDGREPPVSIHLLDSGIEHGTDHGHASHDDQNVDDSSKTLVKSTYADVALDILALVLVLVIVIPVARRLWFDGSDDRPRSLAPHFLRPPLRGPPLDIPC